MVRPFESQHKDMYLSGYDNQDPYRMQMVCRSQTPQRTKTNAASDEEHPEMIIPKDFSNQKYTQNSFKGKMPH